MFTKQHYKAIAEIVKSKDHKTIVDKLAEYFKADNPLFKKELFVAACSDTT